MTTDQTARITEAWFENLIVGVRELVRLHASRKARAHLLASIDEAARRLTTLQAALDGQRLAVGLPIGTELHGVLDAMGVDTWTSEDVAMFTAWLEAREHAALESLRRERDEARATLALLHGGRLAEAQAPALEPAGQTTVADTKP